MKAFLIFILALVCALPEPKSPQLREISPLLAKACEADPEEYHCRAIERIAYWMANQEHHDDSTFLAQFGDLKPKEYHIKHVMRDPSAVNASIEQFERYFKQGIASPKKTGDR